MKKILIITAFINLFFSGSFSQKADTITEYERMTQEIAGSIEILCDSTNSLCIDQIIRENKQYSFISLSSFNKKLSNKNTYWVRFIISTSDAASSRYGLCVPLENHIVDVYTVTVSSLISERTGFFVGHESNNEIIPLSNIVRLKAYGRSAIYLKIKNINDELPRFSISLADIDKALLKNKRRTTIDAIVQGMIWLMILYGLFLFVLHKEKLYIYYSAYSLCLALWLMGTWGFYYQFDLGLPRHLYIYQSIPGFLGIFFYIQFIRTFLSTPMIFRRWDKVLKIIQFVTIAEAVRISVFVPVTNLVMVNYYMQASVSMLLEVFLMIFILKVFATEIQFKYIIGIGSLILILCNFAGAFLWIIYNDNSWFILQKGGAVAELMIFNFGLSYRYRTIEKKEQKLQKKLIVQLNKNAELQQKVTRELEQKVMERTVELTEKNKMLQDQKEEIEYHNRNLTTSIQYARRIQSALFPSGDLLKESLPEHFILFRPLDIVSGDFFWFGQKGRNTFVAAADCMGHGVPGAFMSILGITSLNEIIARDVPVNSDEMLNKLREHVISTLHQEKPNSPTRDGIEMALCIIDSMNMSLQYSGAFRPIYHMRDGRLQEIPCDHMPVGIYEDRKEPFTRKEISIKTGDIIYLFSDGYIDQIGGEERKTFKAARFKETLTNICHLPMDEQKKMLEKRLDEWRGDNEQIDDILVIGIRISEK